MKITRDQLIELTQVFLEFFSEILQEPKAREIRKVSVLLEASPLSTDLTPDSDSKLP